MPRGGALLGVVTPACYEASRIGTTSSSLSLFNIRPLFGAYVRTGVSRSASHSMHGHHLLSLTQGAERRCE